MYQNLLDKELSTAEKRELCNILNYEMLSNGERHTVAYSIERLIHSVERAFDQPKSEEKLWLPEIEYLKRHEYE